MQQELSTINIMHFVLSKIMKPIGKVIKLSDDVVGAHSLTCTILASFL